MAGAWYQGSALDATRFGVYATPQPGVTLPTWKRRSTRVIAEVVEDGVTEDELDRAKTRLIADAVYAQDNQASLARWYGVALTTGSTVDDVRTLAGPHRSRHRRRGAGRRRPWLDKRRSVTGYLVKDRRRGETLVTP